MMNYRPLLGQKEFATEQEQTFAEYLVGKKTVIADSNSISRVVIAQCLAALGARTTDMTLTTNYDDAREAIVRLKPNVVICDYDLGKRCGLDLLPEQRATRPESKDTLFILVTGNTSQSAIARAAEEDIDTFIIKPFTPTSLKAAILKTAISKLRPPAYLIEIDKGKMAMNEGRYDDAFGNFEKAKSLDTTPELACYYLAQAKMLKQAYEGALEHFEEGLGYNQIHYKSLVGLHELLLKKGEHQRAYQVIRKISGYFPANPQRLNGVLRLAIQTGNFDDIDQYYETYKNIDHRTEEMVRTMCAALVVAGKFYLKSANLERCVSYFNKATVSCGGKTRIFREIVISLTEHGQFQAAEEFLIKFPLGAQKGTDYAACNLLLTDKVQGPSFAIARGREYIKQGLHDPLIYKILIERSYEAGYTDSADDLVKVARSRWPENATSVAT
ncbi:response regulator [Bdellovibrionota bacterium FG-1]